MKLGGFLGKKIKVHKGNYSFLGFLFLVFLTSVGLISCAHKFVRNKEAREDVEMYRSAVSAQKKFQHKIKVDIETDPVQVSNIDDDSADDPAIWYNEQDPSNSVVYGSNKLSGIHAYDLGGKQLQYVPCGMINNVDVRNGVKLGGKLVDVLAGSNRTDNSISFFIIREGGKINSEPDFSVGLGEFSPYGFCLYKSKDDQLFAFANSKTGLIKQLKIDLAVDGNLTIDIDRQLQLETQIEGMVVDEDTQSLYVGEEQKGIHIFSASPEGSTKGRLLAGSTEANPNIKYDLEGLALLPPHYLIASSQGNFSYAIFDLESDKYVSSFVLTSGQVDGVEETDGIEILSLNLGDNFPNGILIAQDGFNFKGDNKAAQNFKYVDLAEIVKLIRS
jgi:3-phytase